jgi:archaemetzincin
MAFAVGGANRVLPERKVVVIPIGAVPADALDHLQGELAALLEREVVIGPTIPLPAIVRNDRGQFLGSDLLAELEKLPVAYAERLVGLIDADIYAPKLGFIFGQARNPGRVAVVALPRLRDSFRAHPDHPEHFPDRLLKVAAHELGHSFGFAHCAERQCVMHFSGSVIDLDESGRDYCRRERSARRVALR